MRAKSKIQYPPRFWAALVIFSLTGQIAWVVENMYFNVFIYKMFRASAASISTMVAASAVSATLTTILVGALSDKIGRRKLFICGGYILWGISIASFALIRSDVIGSLFPMAASTAAIGVSLVIIMDCIMTFFGSSANDAAFNAWLTDATPEAGRGAAEGVNAMMPLMAILVVFGGFMGFDLDRPESWTTIYLLIGGAVLLIGIAGCFLIHEVPDRRAENRDHIPDGKAGMFQGLRISFQVLIPGIIGPYIGAAVLQNADTIVNDDGTTSFVPNENIYLAALVVAILLLVVLVVEFKMLKKKAGQKAAVQEVDHE